MKIIGYLLTYKVNQSGNVWMLRFDTKAQAQAHIDRIGLNTPDYQCIINPIVDVEGPQA